MSETASDLVIGTKGGDRLRLRFESFEVADASLRDIYDGMRRTDGAVASIQAHTHIRMAEVAYACHATALVPEAS